MARTPKRQTTNKPASDRTPEKPVETTAVAGNVTPKKTKFGTPPARTGTKAPRICMKRRIQNRPPLPVSHRISRFLSLVIFMLMGGGLVYGISSVSNFLAEDLGRSLNLPPVYIMGFLVFLFGAMLSAIIWALGFHEAVLTYFLGPAEGCEDSPIKQSSEKGGKRGGLRSSRKKNK